MSMPEEREPKPSSPLFEGPEDQVGEWEDPLEALRRAYAEHLQPDEAAESAQGDVDLPAENVSRTEEQPSTPLEKTAAAGLSLEERPTAAADSAELAFEVTPRSIVEAMLFVGHPDNEPLTSEQAAARMRGVGAEEVEQLIAELNSEYDRLSCPYSIASQGAGYRLVLRDDYAWLRNKFYGKVREARLSQAAVDVLAVVAYRQPVTRESVDELRGKDSGALLRQLVRRKLLRLELPAEKGGDKLYHTTERFLDLFGLESLADLPQSEEIETTH